jgi:integrase/recombinase XerD
MTEHYGWRRAPVARWTRPDMLMRYTKAQASSRAAEEASRLNLGEL